MALLFKREREDGVDGVEYTEGDEPPSPSGNPIREFLERSQQTFEEWQKKVDERIRSTVESLSPLSGLEKEVRALSQRLADLEKRLEERD